MLWAVLQSVGERPQADGVAGVPNGADQKLGGAMGTSEEDELEEQDIWGEILPGMVNSDGAAFGGTGAKEGPGCVVDNEVPRYVRASPRADLCAYTSDGRSYTTGAPSSMSGSSLIF